MVQWYRFCSARRKGETDKDREKKKSDKKTEKESEKEVGYKKALHPPSSKLMAFADRAYLHAKT